jgi:hypothetical protein
MTQTQIALLAVGLLLVISKAAYAADCHGHGKDHKHGSVEDLYPAGAFN